MSRTPPILPGDPGGRRHRLPPRLSRLLPLFAGVLLPLWLFGQIAEHVHAVDGDGVGLDRSLMLAVRTASTPFLDQLMLGASLIGSGIVVGAIDVAVFIGLLTRRRPIAALYWAVATGGAALLNLLAKAIYARARPDFWVPLESVASSSFPSGHTMQSMALATAAVLLLWRTRVRVWALAAGLGFTGAVGLSRVYLGVHYPSDVLAGWAASLAWVVGVWLLFGHRVGGPRPAPRASP